MVETDFGGFTVAYEQEELQFPIYVLAGMAAAFLFEAINLPSYAFFVASLVLVAAIYHNAPLLETGTPRLSAGSKGLSIYSLGLVAWRSISAIELVSSSLRGAVYYEIRVTLNQPITTALVMDGRHLPLYRALMRRPWALVKPSTIRIPSDIFDLPAADIFKALTRAWKFYRGSLPLNRRPSADDLREREIPFDENRAARNQLEL